MMMIKPLLCFPVSHLQSRVVLLFESVRVVDLQHDETFVRAELEAHVRRKRGGRGVASPSVHDLVLAKASGVVQAVPMRK